MTSGCCHGNGKLTWQVGGHILGKAASALALFLLVFNLVQCLSSHLCSWVSPPPSIASPKEQPKYTFKMLCSTAIIICCPICLSKTHLLDRWGDGYANYHNLIIIYYIHVLTLYSIHVSNYVSIKNNIKSKKKKKDTFLGQSRPRNRYWTG